VLELVLFLGIYTVAAIRRERSLLGELLAALRRRPQPAASEELALSGKP
jgi:hypothetical protein